MTKQELRTEIAICLQNYCIEQGCARSGGQYCDMCDMNEGNKDLAIYLSEKLPGPTEVEEYNVLEMFNGHFSDDVNKDDPCYNYTCSKCKCVIATNDDYDNRQIGRFCPNCGAKVKRGKK